MSELTIASDGGPIIATAIHSGHRLRDEVAALIALTKEDRLREEDPFTDGWLFIADHRVVTPWSRFEVDVNRPRDRAVYLGSEDAWGLELWREPPPGDIVERSLNRYDAFYAALGDLCDGVASDHARFVVLDLHSYNHRRSGPETPAEDPEANPEVNVGTGSLDRPLWSDVVEGFMEALASHPFDGGHLDVRENVRFRGGNMSRWINERYAGRGCCLAIEVKKVFMDEWTGVPDEAAMVNIGEALLVATNAVRQIL